MKRYIAMYIESLPSVTFWQVAESIMLHKRALLQFRGSFTVLRNLPRSECRNPVSRKKVFII